MNNHSMYLVHRLETQRWYFDLVDMGMSDDDDGDTKSSHFKFNHFALHILLFSMVLSLLGKSSIAHFICENHASQPENEEFSCGIVASLGFDECG